MKTLCTLLFTCLFLTSFANNKATFQKLAEVNACWKAQPDLSVNELPAFQNQSEHAWIQLHLQLVERILRSRDVAHLSPTQQQNRKKSLDHLHQYWQAGRFPINDQYAYRTPIFIDKYDNFCAVGYLVKASGHESVSRIIAANTNLAYVGQMNYPELNDWAGENGFTKEELAWIQPGYPPTQYSEPLGKGVDSTVHELFPDGDTLYVGGDFVKADSTITVNHIAYVTESGGAYTWHAMDRGVNGPVYAITKFNNRIYIAGHFSLAGDSAVTNVAYWENGLWHNSGCTYGEIRDLIVYKNQLYAAGDFDICAALMDVNFARLNGQYWQQMIGLVGRVNTMEVMDSVLLLGGSFSLYNDTAKVNAIKWTESGSFQKFTVGTKNEINDFEPLNGTMYAVGNYLPGGDSNYLSYRVTANTLDTFSRLIYDGMVSGHWVEKPVFKTMSGSGNELMLGGQFFYASMVYARNCISLSSAGWFDVDSTINKMVRYKAGLIAAGGFKNGYAKSPFSQQGTSIRLNGIAKRYVEQASVPGTVNNQAILHLYPNPIQSGSQINLENNFNATNYQLRDISGKLITTGDLASIPRQTVGLPPLAAGLYLFQITNSNGGMQVSKLVVQ